VRADAQVDAVRDRRVPRTADPRDAPVLHADVRLDDPDHGIDDDRADDDRVELARANRA
jgi:hypothetical protein